VNQNLEVIEFLQVFYLLVFHFVKICLLVLLAVFGQLLCQGALFLLLKCFARVLASALLWILKQLHDSIQSCVDDLEGKGTLKVGC